MPGNNITFICGTERVVWNGLAYLGSLCTIFKPKSGEEQVFTAILPDYDAALVKKFLVLISTGSAKIYRREHEAIKALVKDFGVSSVF